MIDKDNDCLAGPKVRQKEAIICPQQIPPWSAQMLRPPVAANVPRLTQSRWQVECTLRGGPAGAGWIWLIPVDWKEGISFRGVRHMPSEGMVFPASSPWPAPVPRRFWPAVPTGKCFPARWEWPIGAVALATSSTSNHHWICRRLRSAGMGRMWMGGEWWSTTITHPNVGHSLGRGDQNLPVLAQRLVPDKCDDARPQVHGAHARQKVHLGQFMREHHKFGGCVGEMLGNCRQKLAHANGLQEVAATCSDQWRWQTFRGLCGKNTIKLRSVG